MFSKQLAEHGVVNKIAGAEYNFRYQKVGKTIMQDVETIQNELGIAPTEIYSGQQTHSANVVYVDGKNGEPFVFGRTFKETDGLLTDQPNIALLIKFADCTPVVLYDPVRQVLASVHSGWRGTVQRISEKAIEKMVQEFNCKREDILAYLGPSIDQDHYEVGSEVYDAFEEFSSRDRFFVPKGEKFHLSMIEANKVILKDSGILSEHIEVETASTYTDSRLHSAREEGKEYQLNAMIAMISQPK